jgi:hypothetical protein
VIFILPSANLKGENIEDYIFALLGWLPNQPILFSTNNGGEIN